MVEGPAMRVSVHVGWFMVDIACETPVLLSCHLNIKKRNHAIPFLLHGELDAPVL